MKRPYYSLLVRDDQADAWSIHFGDYDLTVVQQEREDIAHEFRKRNMKIVRTDDTQAAINAAVDKLNAPFDPPFTIMTLDDPAEVHNAIADAVGEPQSKLKR